MQPARAMQMGTLLIAFHGLIAPACPKAKWPAQLLSSSAEAASPHIACGCRHRRYQRLQLANLAVLFISVFPGDHSTGRFIAVCCGPRSTEGSVGGTHTDTSCPHRVENAATCEGPSQCRAVHGVGVCFVRVCIKLTHSKNIWPKEASRCSYFRITRHGEFFFHAH